MPLSSIAAADVGGTHITVGMVYSGRPPVILGQRRHYLDSAGTAIEVLRTIADAMRPLNLDGGFGLALPGPFDYQRGIAQYNGVGKFDALRGMNIGSQLSRLLRVPPDSIHFIKDADAYAIGEVLAGSGAGAHRVVLITLGTGIGSSFLVDGQPATGDDVPPLGDVYPLQFEGRSLEEYVSRRALRRDYMAATGLTADVVQIAERARRGEEAASRVLDRGMTLLATIVGPALREFGTERIVLGGSMAKSSDVLIPPFAAALREKVGIDPPIVAGEMFDIAPLIGAAEMVAASQGRHV